MISVALGSLVFLVLLNVLGVLRPIQSIVGFVVRPVAGIFNIGGNTDEENRRLEEKVANLTSELAKREEAQRENDSLRAQLNFGQTNNFQLLQADIISQDPTNFQQFFTINRGSSSGVGKGMTVVWQGLLVGRIIDTTATTAKVYLITDFNSAVPVITQRTRATGVVRGERGFGLQLTMIAQTDKLEEGDTVITSGFGGDYTRDLVIGTVGSIKKKDADVFQSAAVIPAVDFRKLDTVFIITGQK